MNLHEYQAKKLLAAHGVGVPPGSVCATAEEARAVAFKLFAEGHKKVSWAVRNLTFHTFVIRECARDASR